MFNDFDIIKRNGNRRPNVGGKDENGVPMYAANYGFEFCTEDYTVVDFVTEALQWKEDADLMKMKLDEKGLSQFLNRLFNARMELQANIFQTFENALQFHIRELKASGSMDDKLTTISGRISIKHKKLIYKDPASGAKCEYVELKCNRGFTFQAAMEERKKAKEQDRDCFFYQAKNNPPGYPKDATKPFVLMLEKKTGVRTGQKGRWHSCIKPNLGYTSSQFSRHDVSQRFEKMDVDANPALLDKVKKSWTALYDDSEHNCQHYRGKCPIGDGCTYGLRVKSQGIITGSMMPIWAELTAVILGQNRDVNVDFLKIGKARIEDPNDPDGDPIDSLVGVICDPEIYPKLASTALEKQKEINGPSTFDPAEQDTVLSQENASLTYSLWEDLGSSIPSALKWVKPKQKQIAAPTTSTKNSSPSIHSMFATKSATNSRTAEKISSDDFSDSDEDFAVGGSVRATREEIVPRFTRGRTSRRKVMDLDRLVIA
jgi:hypothetical protein